MMSDPESAFFSDSDVGQASLDSLPCTPVEATSLQRQDIDTVDLDSASTEMHHEQVFLNDLEPGSQSHASVPSSSSNEPVASPRSPPQVSHPTAPFCQDQQASVTKKRRFPRLGQNLDGTKKFRLTVRPCRKKEFLRRLHATKDLGDDFYIPNRAQLILDFLRKHGDRMVKEEAGS